MGCANSKLGREGSTEVMPSRLGPILRNRLENIRRRRRVADAMTLKESTLSTKELLEDAAAPDSSEDTSSRRSTSKPDREDEDHRHSLPFFPCNDRIPPEEKELKEKGRDEEGGRGTHQPKECTMKSEDIDDERKMQKLREEKMIEAVTAAIEQVAMQEVINEEDREKLDENDEHKDDDNDESKMRIPSKSDDYICPGSPSFRVYCVASVSADDSDNDTDECGDINDAPKITSKSEDSSEIRESVNSNEGHDSVTNKSESHGSKGKRPKGLRKVIGKKRSGAMKNLLNVKSCYYPSCSGQDRTRLLSEKAADS
ncbi:uncharacterized protein LOC116212707 [Punica granatum]|uniref:Uncharacterized protein n=2 Tax=Punica granatum TaxID=22663 RepID=A0A2I0JJZ6_PUNGR|nr:uncharacterized protein LOC116212707 [Punica granatum]PKI56582.1 hypothetical protein CRG98_023026 [Punica granatum]